MRLSNTLFCYSKRLKMSHSKSYLLWISNEHMNFQIPELESLFTLFKLDRKPFDEKKVYGPFMIVDFNSEEDARKLMSRSVLARRCYEIWATGDTLTALHDNLKKAYPNYLGLYKSNSFSIRIETFGNVIAHSEKLKMIHSFAYLPNELGLGEVNLSSPQISLNLIQYFGLDGKNKPKEPYFNFFGRLIADSPKQAQSISLKTRKFIGNTSMDPTLSLLMSNLALIGPSDLVYDPFVGTGGIIVAAGLHGGVCFGGDIDYLMIHGKTRPSRVKQEKRDLDESVQANFKQYGIEEQYLDVIVCDASRPFWRENIEFDAIVTDPPYGVRESTEKVGSKKAVPIVINEGESDKHYPSKVKYSLQDIYKDLLNFAAKRIGIGRRVLCWIPVNRIHYDPVHLPKHPSFKLLYNCEQIMTYFTSRRLLVYEKFQEPSGNDEAEFEESASLMFQFNIHTFDSDFKKDLREDSKILEKGNKKGTIPISQDPKQFQFKI